MMTLLDRRSLIVGGLSLGLSSPILAAPTGRPASGRLEFEVWRKGRRIGSHSVEFAQDGDALVVSIAADMSVKLGPVALFRYRHRATETWRDGRFEALRSRTTTNGKSEGVEARRSADGVAVATLAGKTVELAPASLPLTHWNPDALSKPLFNPQTGAAVRKTLSREAGQSVTLADGRSVPASRCTLKGDADIVDWYDANGVWTGLRGRAEDNSYIDYRRV